MAVGGGCGEEEMRSCFMDPSLPHSGTKISRQQFWVLSPGSTSFPLHFPSILLSLLYTPKAAQQVKETTIVSTSLLENGSVFLL